MREPTKVRKLSLYPKAFVCTYKPQEAQIHTKHRHKDVQATHASAYTLTHMILYTRFTCRYRRTVRGLTGLYTRSIALPPPAFPPRLNACDRHPIAMPPRKPLYILVGMFYNPSKDTLERARNVGKAVDASQRASTHLFREDRSRADESHTRVSLFYSAFISILLFSSLFSLFFLTAFLLIFTSASC